jgi:hypothetical protein
LQRQISHGLCYRIYNLDDKIKGLSEKSVFFDTDTSFVICDNSAKTHICNDKHMFSKLREILTRQAQLQLLVAETVVRQELEMSHGHGKMTMAKLTVMNSRMSTISLNHQSTSLVSPLLPSISMMKKELVLTPRHHILAAVLGSQQVQSSICTLRFKLT